MNKIALVLTVLAVLHISPVRAEWIQVAKTYEDNIKGDDIYIDPARIAINGNVRRAWVLTNFSRIAPGRMPSGVELIEIECHKLRQHRLSAFLYHGPMATEGIAASDDNQSNPWKVPPPNTVDEAIARYVCAQAVKR
jgi:hypothetical protein